LIAHSLHGLSWPIVIVLLILFFFYSHYLFASATAHVSAILFAFIGVLYMTLKVGEFPIVSLMLAFSFGIYGLLKKVVHIDAISSITVECIVTAPAGLIYVGYLWQQHQLSFGMNMSSFWLLFSGANK